MVSNRKHSMNIARSDEDDEPPFDMPPFDLPDAPPHAAAKPAKPADPAPPRVSNSARALRAVTPPPAAPAPYLDGLNPEQRAAVEATGRAGAGAGRRGHRQDPGADHAPCAHPGHRPRAALGDAGRHLHQQGRARDARADRRHRSAPQASRACGGSAPSTRSAAQILRRHAELVGLKSSYTILDTDDQERLIKQVLEAENIDAKRWPARQLAGLIDQLEEPRPDARQAAAGRGRALRQRQGRRRSTPRTRSACGC